MSTSPILPGGNHRLVLTRHHSSENSAASQEEKDATPTPRHSPNLTERVSQHSNRVVIRHVTFNQQETEPPPTVHQPAQSNRASTGSEKTWTTFLKTLNPVRAYQKAQAQHQLEKQKKAEQKQQAALEQQRTKQAEADLANYFTAIQSLRCKLLNKDAPLNIPPDSLQRTEIERLVAYTDIDHNRYPLYERQANIKAGDKTYHLELTEMRKADPNQRTSHPWMYPTNKAPEYCRQDIREQEPRSRYRDNMLITFTLSGPDKEQVRYERHPNPHPPLVSVDYTEPGGAKKHHRDFGNWQTRRAGDQAIFSLTEGFRKTINHAEIKRIIEQQVDNQTEQDHLKAQLDQALVYSTPQVEGKPTKAQKKALAQYTRTLGTRKQHVEDLMLPILIANAEHKKISASRTRSTELPEAQEALKSQFDNLVSALNEAPPAFDLPKKRSTHYWPNHSKS